MAYEHREGSGILFNNSYKENPKQPDLKGEIMIGGKLMAIAGWKKQGQKGEFISVFISEKREAKKPEFEQQKVEQQKDDDLPF